MLGIQQRLTWDSDESLGANLSRILSGMVNPKVMARAIPLATELFLGIKKKAPSIETQEFRIGRSCAID